MARRSKSVLKALGDGSVADAGRPPRRKSRSRYRTAGGYLLVEIVGIGVASLLVGEAVGVIGPGRSLITRDHPYLHNIEEGITQGD